MRCGFDQSRVEMTIPSREFSTAGLPGDTLPHYELPVLLLLAASEEGLSCVLEK